MIKYFAYFLIGIGFIDSFLQKTGINFYGLLGLNYEYSSYIYCIMIAVGGCIILIPLIKSREKDIENYIKNNLHNDEKIIKVGDALFRKGIFRSSYVMGVLALTNQRLFFISSFNFTAGINKLDTMPTDENDFCYVLKDIKSIKKGFTSIILIFKDKKCKINVRFQRVRSWNKEISNACRRYS